MATSLNYSQKPDLLPLARVAGALQAVAAPAGIEFFLMGAAARPEDRKREGTIGNIVPSGQEQAEAGESEKPELTSLCTFMH